MLPKGLRESNLRVTKICIEIEAGIGRALTENPDVTHAELVNALASTLYDWAQKARRDELKDAAEATS